MTIIVGDYWYSWCFMGYCMAIIWGARDKREERDLRDV